MPAMLPLQPNRIAALLLAPLAALFLMGMANPSAPGEETRGNDAVSPPPALESPATRGQVEGNDGVPLMDDLRDVATDLEVLRERQIPMLLFFHATYCGYCRTVDEEFLQTMAEDEAYRDRLLIRRVEIDSDTPEIQWQDVSYTPIEFARLLGVQLVPQVMFFDPNGQQVVDELKGVTVPDFYPAYLDQRLKAAERCIDEPTLPVCTDGIDRPRRDLATF